VPAPSRIGFQPFPQSRAPFQFERQYPLSIGTVYTEGALTEESRKYLPQSLIFISNEFNSGH
jgi:hypothetical protein